MTLSVQNVQRKQFDNIWDIFNKINLNHGQLIDQIVEQVLDSCREERVDKILEFMNHTSNVKWKRIGYQAIFNEINSNSNLSSVVANWLSIQHFVSHDELTAVDLELTELLNQIESITNVLLESPDFELVPQVGFDHQFCIYDIYHTRKIYLEYAIKRMSLNNPIYIARLWKAISTKGQYLDAKYLLQFISTLEQNNHINYTIMTLPYIKKSMINDCNFLKNLNKTFAKETILGSLLVPNQHFYIKSVFNDKYLCYAVESQSNNKNNRPAMCPTKNSTWLITSGEGYFSPLKFLIERNNGDSIYIKKCDLRNEWYTTFSRYSSNSYQAQWDFEVDDVNSFIVRVKNVESGQYLRIGNKHPDLQFSEFDEHESSKFEWIFESVLNNNDNRECRNRFFPRIS